MKPAIVPPAWEEDTGDIGRLVRAVYACISGPAGATRDWDRFRHLHHPLAKCLRTVVEADGATRAAVFDVDSYIADVSPYFADNDFHETEVEQRIRRYGQIAHVWSRYEARRSPSARDVIKRGENSLQLCHEQGRWWIFSTIWDNERPGLAIDPW